MGSRLWRPLNYCDCDAANASRAQGVYIFDEQGNRYYDGYSGLWNANLGYDNEAVRKAMHEQIDRLTFVNPLFFSHDNAVRLADKLCGMLPGGMEKVVFTCTGSEAVEAAIKAARKCWRNEGRVFRNIAVFGNSYHGSYYGSMSASNFEGGYRTDYGPLLPGFISIGIPYRRGCADRAEEDRLLTGDLERWIGQYGDEVSAILIEPVIGSGGVILPPDGYMERLKRFCEERELLLICDEIACGFGRSGTMFGFERFGLKPDIVTLSKGLNNGALPVGAVCMNGRVVSSFRENRQILFHLSTQNLNPVSLAAALATVEQYDADMLAMVNESSRFWQKCLSPLRQLPYVSDIRICGLMIAIDLSDGDGGVLPLDRLLCLLETMSRNGVLAGDSFIDGVMSCVMLFPPYISTRPQIRECVSAIRRSLMAVLE